MDSTTQQPLRSDGPVDDGDEFSERDETPVAPERERSQEGAPTEDPDARPLPDIGKPDDDDPGDERDAVDSVERGSKLVQDHADALAWFLSDEDSDGPATDEFELNVGSKAERWVTWKVRAIPRERIRAIRRQSRVRRGRAETGEVDDVKANLQIAVEGTAYPDLVHIANNVGTSNVPVVLSERFKHKPGLIDQIASRVLEVSGFDEDDVRDANTVRG